MTSPGRGRELTVDEARVERARYARLAELQACRHAEAAAERRYTAAWRCDRDYRRAVCRCRMLGELIRLEADALGRGSADPREQLELQRIDGPAAGHVRERPPGRNRRPRVGWTAPHRLHSQKV